VFGRVYWHFQHEPCVMGWRQGDKPEHDGVHEHTSVWSVDWDGKARVVGNEHPCLHPDALVLTEAGWRPIVSLRAGDRVYAADGRFHAITDVSSHRYTSPALIEIRARGDSSTTLASDNHPFQLWRAEPTWARADAIEIGDQTMTPALPAGQLDPFPQAGTVQIEHEGQLWLLRRVEAVDRVPTSATSETYRWTAARRSRPRWAYATTPRNPSSCSSSRSGSTRSRATSCSSRSAAAARS
jgi:hypothetical protein